MPPLAVPVVARCWRDPYMPTAVSESCSHVLDVCFFLDFIADGCLGYPAHFNRYKIPKCIYK